MALRSGDLFYESRLLVEFSEISFTIIHVSYQWQHVCFEHS